VKRLKEGIQFGLKRPFEKIDQEEDQGGERETTFACEMRRGDFVARNKGVRVDNFFEVTAQVGTKIKRDLCQLEREREIYFS